MQQYTFVCAPQPLQWAGAAALDVDMTHYIESYRRKRDLLLTGLADDYEMGRAVRSKGYTLAIPAMGVGHTAAENSARDLFRHELRWTRTIRLVNPAGHVGSFVTHGFAFALLAAVFLGFNPASLGILALALAARLVLKNRIDGHFGTYAGPYWLMPLRDLLSFAVFLVSLFGETVHWRGTHFAVEPSGAMSQV